MILSVVWNFVEVRNPYLCLLFCSFFSFFLRNPIFMPFFCLFVCVCIQNVHRMKTIAESGVVFLLLNTNLELSAERLIIWSCLPIRLAFWFFRKIFMVACVVLFRLQLYIWWLLYSICSLVLMFPECWLKIEFLLFCT